MTESLGFIDKLSYYMIIFMFDSVINYNLIKYRKKLEIPI